MKKKKMYLSLMLETNHATNIGVSMPLVWSDGMIGVLAVFGSKRDAIRYTGSRETIHELVDTGKVK